MSSPRQTVRTPPERWRRAIPSPPPSGPVRKALDARPGRAGIDMLGDSGIPERERGGPTVLSTMQDAPLLVSGILRHGQQVYGESQVITITGPEGESVQASFTEVADRAERLAAGLRRLGSATATGWVPSCGTTTPTSRPTWASRPWERCSTPSTCGSSPSSWPT